MRPNSDPVIALIQGMCHVYDTFNADAFAVLEDDSTRVRHTHNSECRPRCTAHFDDRDRVVTVTYDGHWQATYGILDGNVSLWCD